MNENDDDMYPPKPLPISLFCLDIKPMELAGRIRSKVPHNEMPGVTIVTMEFPLATKEQSLQLEAMSDDMGSIVAIFMPSNVKKDEEEEED